MDTRFLGISGRWETTGASACILHLMKPNEDEVAQTVINSVYNYTNVMSDLLDNGINTYAVEVQRAYQYAKSTYTHGLPNGTVTNVILNEDKIKDILTDINKLEPTQNIILLSTSADYMSPNIYAVEWLISEGYSYKSTTGLVEGITFTHKGAIPSDAEVMLPSEQFIGSGTVSGAEIFVTGNLDFRVTQPYEVVNPDGSTSTEYYVAFFNGSVVNFAYNQPTSNLEYYTAIYAIEDTVTGELDPTDYVWNYWAGSGEFPDLVIKLTTSGTSKHMFVVPIRVENKFLNEDKESELYKTSSRLLNELGTDFDLLVDNLKESDSLPDIDHAYVTFGANLYSESITTHKYLYKYLEYLMPFNGASINIQDETYNVTFGYSAIRREVKEEVIGTVGLYAAGSANKIFATQFNNDISIPSVGGNTYWVKKQLSKTHTVTYYLDNAVMHNYIYGGWKNGDIVFTVDDFGKDDKSIPIPLNYDVVNSFGNFDRTLLYKDTFIMVINAYERKYIEWYKVILEPLLIVVSVVLSVVTFGWSLAALAAILVAVVVVPVALDLLMEVAVKVFGEVLGTIITAVIAVAVAVFFGNTEGLLNIINLTGQCVGLIAKVGSMYIDMQYAKLDTEIKEFETEYADKMDELETYNDQLKTMERIDPHFIWSSVDMNPLMDISDWFDYKLEYPLQMGYSTLDYVENFFDNELNLPHLY